MSKSLSILRDARAAITNPGTWIQGSWHEGSGHCAVGALEFSARKNHACPSEMHEASDRLSKALPPEINRYSSPQTSIMTFNDRTRTTHNDIIKLFDKAICELENDE